MNIIRIINNVVFTIVCSLPLILLYFLINDYVLHDTKYKVWIDGHYKTIYPGPWSWETEAEDIYIVGHYETKHTNSEKLGWFVIGNALGLYLVIIFILDALFNSNLSEFLFLVFVIISLVFSIAAWIFLIVDLLFYSLL